MPKFDPIPLFVSFPENPVGGLEDGGLHLYVSNPRVVELPEEGTVTFKFKRGPVTLREGAEESEGTASVDLTLFEICAVTSEEVEEPENLNAAAENAVDAIFASLRKSEPKEKDEY